MNNHFLVYLLEASICQLFFYFVYILFLKKETYFNLNRTYLICSILLSLLIPSIQIKHEVIEPYVSAPLQTIVEPIQIVTNMVEDKIESRIDVLFILWIIYIVIAAIVLAKFIYQFFRLMFFIRNGEISVLNRHYLICTNGQYPTSSFFGYILWDNTVALSDKEIEQIIKHEMAHINQFHTLDNLLMELLGILFWFNPFVYLYNKKLKEVHEHIADNEVLNNKEFTSHDYEVLINKQILNNIGFQLSNNFNMSNLKNRIAMITKSRSGKIARLKLTIAIPAAALMMLSFSYAKEKIVTEKIKNENRHIAFYLGTYKGDNLKVRNPSSTTVGDPGYSIKKVSVNNKLFMDSPQCNLDNFEIDFKSMNFTKGDKIKVEIEYLDEPPTIMNLDVIQDPNGIENIRAVIIGTDFQNGNMSTEELLAAGELEINNKKYILKSYTVRAKVNGLYFVENSTNSVFPHNLRGLLKRVKSGDTIMFKEVHAQVFDAHDNYGSIVKLPGVNVIIK
jgi:beta-lactamase regulating signal transducer with metallopeptidase domain